MARIFISYRREEASASAGRLHDRLREHFGRQNVFMDVDSIDPGIDFIEVIERTVGSCDVLIAFIGRQWLTIIEADGHRRIDNPEDFVRHEIATALKRNIRVIPVLIQGTSMPRAVELPDDLQPLTRRHALDLSDQHFHRDVNSLIEMLDQVLGLTPPPASQPGASSTAMPHTEPTSTSPQEPALVVPTARSSYLRSWRIWMLACIITGMLSALVYNTTRSTRMQEGSSPRETTPPAPLPRSEETPPTSPPTSVYDLSGTWKGTAYYPEAGDRPRATSLRIRCNDYGSRENIFW